MRSVATHPNSIACWRPVWLLLLLLGFELTTWQMKKMNVKPYFGLVMTYFADRLTDEFPQVGLGSTVPSCQFSSPFIVKTDKRYHTI